MRARLIAAALTVALSGNAAAQAAADPQCLSQPTLTRDACQQAVDLFKYMAPQLGIAIVGGNPTQGQGGSLGGFPHFTLGVRANLLMGSLPELQTPLPALAQRSNYPTNDQVLGLPAVDLSIGLFKGLPLAISNVGGVDLLLSAVYVPTIEQDEITVTPESNLKLGYGVRVGILQESLLMPGLGVSYMKRDLPVSDIQGLVSGYTLNVDDLDVKTTAWRVTASKSLLLLNISAGAGQDTYEATSVVSAVTPANGTAGPINVGLPEKLTRTNYFGELSLNLMLLKIVGSVGMVQGGEVLTYNTFDKAADASRMFGSVGVRLGF